MEPSVTGLSFLSPERGDVGNLYGLPTREKFGNLATDIKILYKVMIFQINLSLNNPQMTRMN